MPTKLSNKTLLAPGQDYLVAENQTLQYVADNVDHDTVTLDGKNTVHYMGMIAAITPNCGNTAYTIPRLNVTNEELKSLAPNMIKTFNEHGVKELNKREIGNIQLLFSNFPVQVMLW